MLDRFAAIMVISVMVVSVMMFSGTGAFAQSSEGEPSGAVAVGSLLPLTGDLAKHGEENYAASLLAVDDFNQYLEEKGAGWYLDVISEDSETRPTVALEKLQALHAKGVKIVLGPETSSNLRNIKGYADSNQMLLVSCCSTSPSLAIEGDTTFRMSPDDSNQGTATAKLMVDAGIEVVVPVWRDDAWGTGLHEAATESFTGRGGTADDGLSYNPEAAEFSAEASLLADAVQGYVDEYGADKVAVLYIGFGEVVAFMQSASSYDILHEVQWFGSDANTKDPSIVEDRIGLQFATDTSFTTVQVASGKNEKSARVDDSLLESLGRVPSTYASSSYDAVWLVGLSIEAAQSTEVADVAAVIPDVAASHSGALGSIALNAAGDLAQTNYDVWKIVDAEWTLLGIYYSATDTVELEVAESAIEGAVAVGSLLPLTGDLAKHGEENYAASLLAVDDFNQYLEEKGAGWYLDIISEDSETRPTVALEKLQALHAKGVKIVLGPETSSNLRNIKGYADSNQMLLVSCCSTSPSLAIEGDTTFRMSPDDSNQGTATAKLLIDAGIEVVVPVWRDDAWGTGLHEAATESFTGRGGTADDGLSYNPEAAEFSAEASLLADAVQGYVDEYGADKVAVLYIGFGEVVAFMQSASSYDILHDVLWFGSDGNAGDPSIVEDRIGLQFATDTSFTTVQVASGKNEKSAHVDDSLLESLGRVPSTYASSSYDSVWLVGLAIETAQSTEVADVVEAIPGVAASHTGALGSIALNAAGDLAQTNYDVWKIVDAQWNQVGIYYSATDTVELAAAEEVPVDTTETPPTEQQPSGCLIATAAYGSELAPQVQFLREIRDGTLLQTAAGTSLMTGFNQFYYSFSPAVADLERESPIFRDAVKTAITPAIYALNIMALADSDSEVSVLALAIVSICAIAGIYVVGPSLAVYGVARRVRR